MSDLKSISEDKIIYRVIFTQQGKLYEMYANYISEESLMGFIEVDELVFTEAKPSSLVVDPSEEKLRAEFRGVNRFYIPMHTVVRIDEVEKGGPARIQENQDKTSNISQFPGIYQPPSRKDEDS